MKLSVDRNSKMPVYRQIAQQIEAQARHGEIAPGTRLPGERELALELGIARGTLQKAFSQLLREGVVESIHGSGTFIAAGSPLTPGKRRTSAVTRSLRIAVIDCNPEALTLFERQFEDRDSLFFEPHLLDEPELSDDPTERFCRYDLILTTTTHIAEVRLRLPTLTDHILPVAVSPSQRTVVELARIPAQARIGIVCRSQRFRSIIEGSLSNVDVAGEQVTFLSESELTGADASKRLRTFLSDRSHLVVPPDGPLSGPASDFRFDSPMSGFFSKGGRLIRFDYRIEKGSLVYIEEAMARLGPTASAEKGRGQEDG